MPHFGGIIVVIAVVASVIGYVMGRAIKTGYGWLVGGPLVFLAVWLNAENPDLAAVAAGLGFLGAGIAFNPGSKR